MLSPAADLILPVKRMSRLRRWGIRVLRLAALVYLGLAVILYSIQDQIIFPGASTQGQRDAMLTQGHGTELLQLRTAHGTAITALFGLALQSNGQPLADASGKPTVIYFYGNGACMAYSTDVFDRVRRLGANVIIPDFEGYGMSAGKPSESGCYATADAAYDYLLGRRDIDSKKIIPMGWSIGAAVAIDLAGRRPVAGLVTISAFTNLHAMAHNLIPWFPMSLVVKYKFDNIGKISGIACPTLIVHGTRDDLVPFAMAGDLAAAARGSCSRVDISGAGHNDVFDVGGDHLFDELGKFLSRF